MAGEPSDGGGDTAGCLSGLCESGRRSELGELSEVLGGCSEQELVAGAAWTAQSEPTEPEDALEVGEQHLDLLATMSRAFISRCPCQGPGNVAGVFVEVSRDLAGRCVRTARGLESTDFAVTLAAPVDTRPVLGDAGAWGGVGSLKLHQVLAFRTCIAVPLGIEDEVGSRQGAVGAVGLVEHRNVRRDPALLDQPGEVLGRAIGAVGNQALRLEAEALGGPIEHSARGADFGLADGAARFDIEDDRVVGIDQVVGGIGEEGMALVGAGPLSGWVRSRDELRRDRARCAKGGLVESGKVLQYGPTGVSVISCVAGDCILRRHGADEALAEDDSELRLSHGPLTWRHFPLFLRSVQDQIQQLGGGVVAGEVAPGPDSPPQL